MKSVTENVIFTGLERNEVPLVTVTMEEPGGAWIMMFSVGGLASAFCSSWSPASASARRIV